MYKPYRSFLKAIEQHGLYYEIASKNLKIMKDGHMLTTIALTPGDKKVAIDNTLRYLINDGHLPKINRNNYEHELKIIRTKNV